MYFFEKLYPEYPGLWEKYTSYLAVAVNNIHMILDCDVVLGGYVGSCMGEFIRDIRDKVKRHMPRFSAAEILSLFQFSITVERSPYRIAQRQIEKPLHMF